MPFGDRSRPAPAPDADELGEIRWWRPDWRTALGSVGPGWLIALATLAALALLCGLALFAGLEAAFFLLFVRIGVFLGGAAVAVGIYVFKRAIRQRREPFCIFCGYNLTGLPDHYRCPECGRPYTPEMIEDYRRDPGWFIHRWKMREQLPPPDPTLDVPPDAPRRTSRDGT